MGFFFNCWLVNWMLGGEFRYIIKWCIQILEHFHANYVGLLREVFREGGSLLGPVNH